MLQITIDTDNAAFEDLGTLQESARILRALADEIETQGHQPDAQKWPLIDANGATVGEAIYS